MSKFQIGGIVQLNSGGPHMTVTAIDAETITAMWHNPIVGQPNSAKFHEACLKTGAGLPQVPEGVGQMRTTSVAQISANPAMSTVTKSTLHD